MASKSKAVGRMLMVPMTEDDAKVWAALGLTGESRYFRLQESCKQVLKEGSNG